MTLGERLRAIVALLPDSSMLTIPVRDLRALIAEDGEAPPAAKPAEVDGGQWLTAGECAARLHVSTRWCYDHAEKLGARRLSRRCVRFSARVVDRYMARHG